MNTWVTELEPGRPLFLIQTGLPLGLFRKKSIMDNDQIPK